MLEALALRLPTLPDVYAPLFAEPEPSYWQRLAQAKLNWQQLDALQLEFPNYGPFELAFPSPERILALGSFLRYSRFDRAGLFAGERCLFALCHPRYYAEVADYDSLCRVFGNKLAMRIMVMRARNPEGLLSQLSQLIAV